MGNAGYEGCAESELLALARGGDRMALDCLCARYETMCRGLARHYAGSRIEVEDLAQEGMLGWVQAVWRYDPRKGVPFKSFSRVCMVSKMLSALEAAGRLKRKADVQPLSQAEPVPQVGTLSTEEAYCLREDVFQKNKLIQSLLSRSEQEALRLYLRGCTYAQIAAQLEVSQKSVDNALQRVRRKLKAAFRP